MFPLCGKCAEDQQSLPWHERQNTGPHGDEYRMITWVWCTPELEKAMEVGYKILKIYEVWRFPENQRRTHFFAPYVNKWLKQSRRVRGGLQIV